jgi:hypothetical protein
MANQIQQTVIVDLLSLRSQAVAVPAEPGQISVQNVANALKSVDDQGAATSLGGGGVTSAVAGSGVSVSGATGAVTFTNTGVTSIVAGAGISISGGTGAVTITNTGPFSADTTVQLNNSTPAAVSAWESIITLPTATAGAEVSQWVVKTLNAGAQISALTIKGTTWTGPATTLTLIGSSGSGTGSSLILVSNPSHDGRILFGSSGNVFYDEAAATLKTTESVPFSLLRSGAQNGLDKGGSGNLNIGTSIASAVTIYTNTTTKITVPALGGLVVGAAAIATNATDGFLYIPTCAGTPTAVPTTQTGTMAMVFDTTNHKLYLYDGSWKGGTVPGAWS